jgi:alpha-tubulin suppressor-like RCC1 family protein
VPRFELVALEAKLADRNGYPVEGVPTEWSSSDASVAEVAGGEVVGRKMGTARITATAGGKSAEAELLVAPALTDALSANWQQTCALDPVGRAYCWGNNSDGQLGTGESGGYLTTPVAVAGGHRFQAIGTGIRATCALDLEGALYCWGGWFVSPEQSPVPRRMDSRTYVRLSVGLNHACALDLAGDVYCWGQNFDGRVGDGTATDALVPTRALTTEPMVALSAGAGHVCALTADGAPYCWGPGVLPGTAADARTPRPVPTELRFAALSPAGRCGLTQAGELYCWHSGNPTPTRVAGSHRFRNTNQSDCGTTFAGDAYCWGSTYHGRVGLPSGDPLSGPTLVGKFAYISAASQGFHTCAIRLDGLIACTGEEYYGVLGDGSTGFTTAPVRVSETEAFVQVVSGNSGHSCGLTAAGAAWCWGVGSNGQLGNGSSADQRTPVAVSGGKSFVALALGTAYGCGLTAGGEVWCWGANSAGQLGIGTTTGSHATPQRVASGDLVFTSIAAGPATACGLTGDGTAYCWGDNRSGNFGNGGWTSSATPVLAAMGTKLRSISPTDYHTCGVGLDDTGYCWGWEYAGQLGNDGTTGYWNQPTLVRGDHDWQTIRAAHGGTCGLTTSGKAYCWGQSSGGRLGDGTTRTEPSVGLPTPVAGDLTFADLAVNYTARCGMVADGSAYCWGSNYYGQLGNAPVGYRHAFPPVPGRP